MRVWPQRTVDHVALRYTRRPDLAMTSIRVGASYTSLDLWLWSAKKDRAMGNRAAVALYDVQS